MPIYGPFDRGSGRKRYRIVVVAGTTQRAFSYATLREAERALAEAKQEAAGERTLGEAVKEYLAAQEWRPSTLRTTEYRLRGIFQLKRGDRPLEMSSAVAKHLYEQRSTTRAGDTHIAELASAVAFYDWCADRDLVRRNPFEGVESTGRKRAGAKRQLRIDEARRFLTAALAEESREGLAVAMALLLGLRASEITDRVVRDVDDRGRVFWVPCAKTPSGIRSLEVPQVLRAPLFTLTLDATGNPRRATDHLWGMNQRGRPCDRHWLEHHTRRLCGVAKVPEVCPHGLRGLHATLATLNRVSADTVARALGHAGSDVTRRHYIASGAEAGVRAAELSDALLGNSPNG